MTGGTAVSRGRRTVVFAAVAATLAVVAIEPLAAGGPQGTSDAGTLALRAVLTMTSHRGECSEGTPPTIDCHPREGTGIVSGLGTVTESYSYHVGVGRPECPPETFRVFGYPTRVVVLGKGAIEILVAETTDCFALGAVLNPTQAFTITGGSGLYAGASGSGTLQHRAHFTATGAAGEDTWVGTLVVPGLDFDVTAPTLSGAVAKTVRAPRGAKTVRVRFAVTAQDKVDGSLSVACTPRSGTRFKLGKTRVTCAATDRSGNTATAKFTVTVKARR